MRRPQRVTELTFGEEAARAQLTWQSMDHAVSVAASGSAEQLSKYIVDTKAWEQHRSQTVLVSSDQIPIWVLEGSVQQVYAEGEVREKRASRQKGKEGEGEKTLADAMQELPGQLRGAGKPEASRVRVTYEARQVILNWFEDGAQPLGVVDTGVLVASGIHARLSNLDSEGRWIEDEEFEVAGKRVFRKGGTSAGGVMRQWVKLRAQHPDMFSQMEVYQQPAGFMDEIILVWSRQSFQKKYPQAVWQRDLFSAALSAGSRRAMSLAQIIPCWIAGKMTAVLQITDADVAFRLKASCRRWADQLRAELRAEAAAERVRPQLKAGAFEIMWALSKAHAEIVSQNLEQEFVLAAARRNFFLSWRPALSQGRFIRTDSEPWCLQFPEGSHRIDQ